MTLPEHIERLVAIFGSLRNAADALDIDHAFLHRLRTGEKTNPSDKTLARLGLRRVVTYERINPGPFAATPLTPRTKCA